jgi:HEAT repeat protein
MKGVRIALIAVAALLLQLNVRGQDTGRLAARLDTLLAGLPADNSELTSGIMEEILSLGEEGTALLCSRIVPAGTGDDLRARYAVASLTATLTAESGKSRKRAWERQVIRFMRQSSDREVTAFFMKQLNLIGSDEAVVAMADYVIIPGLCEDAVMVLQAVDSQSAAELLSTALTSDPCPCAAQVMVALAEKEYEGAINSYTEWSIKGSGSERASALHALASTGSPAARQPLLRAAEEVSFRREPSGAVDALLLYARKAGLAGNRREMKKITGMVIASAAGADAAGQRIAAMSVITEVMGDAALKMLVKAAGDPDPVVRSAALNLAFSLPGSTVTKKLLRSYQKYDRSTKSEMLYMLGKRGDDLALPLVMKAISDPVPEIAAEAIAALARLKGREATGTLMEWIMKNDSEAGHRAAATALTTLLDSTGTDMVAASLPDSRGLASVTFIRLLAWSGRNKYFDAVYDLTGSSDMAVRATAVSSLASLASCSDQQKIIELLDRTLERGEAAVIRQALVAAVRQCSDPEKGSEVIIAALDKERNRKELIPLLAETGGRSALKRVAWEFEKGDAATRDICFDALLHWPDHTAAAVLLDISASGNKTFGRPSFDAYLKAVSTAPLDEEHKLQMIRDIAPHAGAPDARAALIHLAASLGTDQVRLFIETYLSDPSDEVRSAAADALSTLKPDGL